MANVNELKMPFSGSFMTLEEAFEMFGDQILVYELETWDDEIVQVMKHKGHIILKTLLWN